MTEYTRYDSIAELVEKGRDGELVQVTSTVRRGFVAPDCEVFGVLLREGRHSLFVTGFPGDFDEYAFTNASTTISFISVLAASGEKIDLRVRGKYSGGIFIDAYDIFYLGKTPPPPSSA